MAVFRVGHILFPLVKVVQTKKNQLNKQKVNFEHLTYF